MRVEFSQEILKKLAGEAAYARGVDYFKNGHVTEINHGKNRVTATVEGTDTWHVTLNFRARGLDGACDCPASEGVDFCKHCVAVGLAILTEQDQLNTLEKGSEGDRIKAWLLRQSKDMLTDQLMELVAVDRGLRQRYLLRMAISESGIDYKALRKQITAAIPSGRQLFRYPQVRAYFARVDELVDYLVDLGQSADADKFLELIEYAMARIEKALETIDDSGGFRLDSVARLGEMHCQSFARSKKNVVARVDKLLELLRSDAFELLPSIPSAYRDAMGQEGEALFWQKLQQCWDEIPAPADREARYHNGSMRIEHLLLTRAREQGDVDAELAVEAKQATEQFEFFDLAEFCFKHGRLDEALSWLNRCLHAEPASDGRYVVPIKDTDDRVQMLRSRIHSAQGHHELALAESWTLFAASPNYQTYRHLSALAEAASRQEKESWCKKAVALLQERLAAESQKFGTAHFRFTPTANALVAICKDDGDIAGAWQIADTTPIAVDLLQQLADASWSSHADYSLRAYQRLLASHVDDGVKAAYGRAVGLLRHLQGKMSEHAVDGFDELLAGLKTKYKAKRSFMAMLSEQSG